VVGCLQRLEQACLRRKGAWKKRLGVVGGKLIAIARVPVLKLQLACGIELDVSFNDAGGVNAARFLQSWVSVACAWVRYMMQALQDMA
jgi:DNA polymerase sigma